MATPQLSVAHIYPVYSRWAVFHCAAGRCLSGLGVSGRIIQWVHYKSGCRTQVLIAVELSPRFPQTAAISTVARQVAVSHLSYRLAHNLIKMMEVKVRDTSQGV
jgi:hypothetical protein